MLVPSRGIWAVRGGGEYLHMRASFGARQQNFLLSWMTPYFQDTLWRVGFEMNFTPASNLISKDYDIGTYSFSLFGSYPISPYWTFGTKYRIKNIDISVDIRNKEFKKEVRSNNGLLSGLGASITWDSTDRAVKPHNGLRSIVDAEFVGVGGHVSFLRSAYLNAYYNGLTRRGYMRYRWDFRFIYPLLWTDHFRDIPLSERYFLGGVASVRGYKDYILGPRVPKAVIDSATGKIKVDPVTGKVVKKRSGEPSGGISSSLLSVDYIHEVFPFLDAFVFMDAGYVSNERFQFGTYRMSYGVGVTIDVLGRVPVTLGLGFPVNAKEDTTNTFFFSMGGQF